MGFGASQTQVTGALELTPSELVDSIVDEAMAMPLTEEPEWAFWTLDDYDDFTLENGPQKEFLYKRLMLDMIENGFRDKLTLFWSNHFVTELEVYNCPSYMWLYYSLLQLNVFGYF